MLIKLQNEDKLNDVVEDDAVEGEDYKLGKFDCPYADECRYNNGKMIYKCIGIVNMVRKNCLLESIKDSGNILPKDSPLYIKKGEIKYTKHPIDITVG